MAIAVDRPLGAFEGDLKIAEAPTVARAAGLLLIIPAVSALQVARGFRATIVTAAGIAVFSVVSGIFCSFMLNLPTGATIVIINIMLFVMAFACKRAFLR